jgi:hypothetical protein
VWAPILAALMVAPDPIAHAPIRDLVIRSETVDQARLEAELSLRAPAVAVQRFGPGMARPSGTYAFIDLRPSATGLSLSLILSDGRAYHRELEGALDQRERAVATSVANLLAAIAEDRIEPDQLEAEIPEPEPSPAVDPPPAPNPEPPPVPDPAPDPPAAATGVTFAPWLAPAIVFGLGPPASVPGAVTPAGAIGLDVSFGSGLLVQAHARVGGARNDDYRLGRVRAAAGAGYQLRRDRFGLVASLVALVEPWRVSGPGGPRTPELLATGTRATTVLLGGELALVPALHLPSGPRRARVRLGLPMALALTSGVDAPGTVRVELHRAGEATVDLFRLGGVELTIGLSLAVEITAR